MINVRVREVFRRSFVFSSVLNAEDDGGFPAGGQCYQVCLGVARYSSKVQCALRAVGDFKTQWYQIQMCERIFKCGEIGEETFLFLHDC